MFRLAVKSHWGRCLGSPVARTGVEWLGPLNSTGCTGILYNAHQTCCGRFKHFKCHCSGVQSEPLAHCHVLFCVSLLVIVVQQWWPRQWRCWMPCQTPSGFAQIVQRSQRFLTSIQESRTSLRSTSKDGIQKCFGQVRREYESWYI